MPINRIITGSIPRDLAVTSANVSTSLAEIQNTQRVIVEEFNEVYTLLNSLEGGTGGRIASSQQGSEPNPWSNGMDGANILMDLSSTPTDWAGLFWKDSRSRPKTIKELFLDTYGLLSGKIKSVEDRVDDMVPQEPPAPYDDTLIKAWIRQIAADTISVGRGQDWVWPEGSFSGLPRSTTPFSLKDDLAALRTLVGGGTAVGTSSFSFQNPTNLPAGNTTVHESLEGLDTAAANLDAELEGKNEFHELLDTNIDLNNIASGQVAIYDDTQSKWVNASITGAANQIQITEGDGSIEIGIIGGAPFDGMYTGPDEPTPEDVGGIEAGSNFSANGEGPIAITDLITRLLYPYQEPAFSAFSIDGQSTLIECGIEIPQNVTFVWTTTNSSNVVVDSIDIEDAGVADNNFQAIIQDTADDSTEAHDLGAAITRSTPGRRRFKIKGTNNKQPVAGEFSRTFTVTWGLQVYYGTSADAVLPNGFDFNTMSSILKTAYAATYQFPGAENEYKYIAIPKVWAGANAAVAWTDTMTSFNVPNSFQAEVTITRHGVDTVYNIYRSDNQLGAAMSIAIA